MPSLASILSSIVFVIFILAFHLLLLTSNSELVISELAVINPDDRLTNFYASTIQGPIDKAFANDTLGVLSTALIWGLVGWVVYELIEFIVGNLYKLKSSQSEITSPAKSEVISHPLRKQLIVRLLWRFFIGLAITTWTIYIQPYLLNLFQRDLLILSSESPSEALYQILAVFLGWIFILHVYVVLMRFFVLRTRYFGEIIY